MRCVPWLTAIVTLGCSQGAANPATNDDITTTPDVQTSNTGVQPSPSSTSSGANSSGVNTETSQSSDAVTDSGPPPCKPGPGTSGSPSTVIEVVEMLNGLPRPVTIPCFLQALDRPLRVLASASFISAQPAFGLDNPRIFILGDGISLTVVANGTGGNLLEMGELTSNTHSIKAELEFPIAEPLNLDAAFVHIRSELHAGTVCFGCHHQEVEVADYPVAGAFESVAYRPLPDQEVSLEQMKVQFSACDPETEPDRCTFYAALFDHGEVLPGRFPDEMPLFQ